MLKQKAYPFGRITRKGNWVNEFRGYAFLCYQVILLIGYVSINIKEKG